MTTHINVFAADGAIAVPVATIAARGEFILLDPSDTGVVLKDRATGETLGLADRAAAERTGLPVRRPS